MMFKKTKPLFRAWKWNWSNIECQIFCLKKWGKWGLREAFHQNSLMQLFNGDRHIVHWSFVALSSTWCVPRASLMLSWFVDLFVNRPRHSKSKSHKYSSCFSHWLRVAKRGRWYKIAQICRTECPQCARRRQALQNQNPFLSQCVFLFSC